MFNTGITPGQGTCGPNPELVTATLQNVHLRRFGGSSGEWFRCGGDPVDQPPCLVEVDHAIGGPPSVVDGATQHVELIRQLVELSEGDDQLVFGQSQLCASSPSLIGTLST